MQSYAEEEMVRFVRLDGDEDSRELEERCRAVLARLGKMDGSMDQAGAAPPEVWIAGRRNLDDLTETAVREAADIDLLVAYGGVVLDYPQLLARCRQVLLFPCDDALLERQLGLLLHSTEMDPATEQLLAHNLIGHSASMQALRRRIATVSGYPAPVMICGETGTGKELVARALHYCGDRSDLPFVPVNCAALNDELLLAELFGHEKGAFTDARQARRGLVAQAEKGTLFLDEIDSLSARAQGSLLRFLQDNEYRPVGSDRIHHADVHVVCATNRDLHAATEQGSFREDLYFRLNVIDVHVPPLRMREGDIPLLAEHFLGRFAARYDEPAKTLHPLTLDWMNRHEWPGNVRELENHLHRSHVMTEGPCICMTSVHGEPIVIEGGGIVNPGLGSFSDEKARVIADFEKEYLHRIMQKSRGNLSRAARQAGKERRAFARLLAKHGIDRSAYEQVRSEWG